MKYLAEYPYLFKTLTIFSGETKQKGVPIQKEARREEGS